MKKNGPTKAEPKESATHILGCALWGLVGQICPLSSTRMGGLLLAMNQATLKSSGRIIAGVISGLTRVNLEIVLIPADLYPLAICER